MLSALDHLSTQLNNKSPVTRLNFFFIFVGNNHLPEFLTYELVVVLKHCQIIHLAIATYFLTTMVCSDGKCVLSSAHFLPNKLTKNCFEMLEVLFCLAVKCTQNHRSAGLRPEPLGGGVSAPPDSIAGFCYVTDMHTSCMTCSPPHGYRPLDDFWPFDLEI